MDTKSITLQESEFLAENQLIDIRPNFHSEQLNFIIGDFGPFRPQKPTKVPLWLALYLRKRNKCSIYPPNWMDEEYLKSLLELEKAEPLKYSEMPFYYQEMATLLLDNAEGDIKDAGKIRSLLEDLINLRSSKWNRDIKSIDTKNEMIFSLENICSMEMCGIRDQYIGTLKAVQVMDEIAEQRPTTEE